MFCPKCGANIIADDSNFCQRCGFYLREVQDQLAREASQATHAPPGPTQPEKSKGSPPPPKSTQRPTPLKKRSRAKVFLLTAGSGLMALILITILAMVLFPTFYDNTRNAIEQGNWAQLLSALGGKSEEEVASERDAQLLAKAVELANQSKIEQSLAAMRTISHSEFREQIKQTRLALATKVIQGSWAQSQGGMGYTRIIHFDAGIITVYDDFTNSQYRGTYEVRGATDTDGFLSLDTYCTVKYGFQETNIYLAMKFKGSNSFHVSGTWAPASNGTYTRVLDLLTR